MGYHCLVPLSAAIANFIICIVVLRQGMREALNRAFAWMVLTLAAWNVDIFCLSGRESASRLPRHCISLWS